MDQIERTDTLRPDPPFAVTEDLLQGLEAVLPMWVYEIQGVQTTTPYHGIDSSIPAIIFALLLEKRPDIYSAFHMKGGWEGWFQVELALCLQKRGYTVEREVHVFKAPLEAADLFVTSPHGICTIIELKCEGLYQDITDVQFAASETRPKFAARIEADTKKFGAGGERLLDNDRDTFFCCVGVSCTRDSTAAAISHRPVLNGLPWFNGLSLDRIALYAVEHELLAPNPIYDTVYDDLVMWWSGMHQKM